MVSKFNPDDSLGAQPPQNIKAYLLEIGDDQEALQLATGQGLLARSPWRHTGVSVGFIGDSPAAEKIVSAFALAEDSSLRGQRIKITLNKFHLEKYPGFGTHRVLCEFSGKNQIAGETEELCFAITGEARNRASTGIQGKPIFMGVTVGPDGVSFEGRAVNIASSDDDLILDVLQTDAFKAGLALASQLQPAIKPFAGLAAGVVKLVASRNKNRQIHTFSLGLDFGNNATSIRLRYGSYIVVQSDVPELDWKNLRWRQGAIIDIENDNKPVALNYMVFGISPFSGDTPKARSR